MVFANEDSPLFVPGAFEVAAAMVRDEPKDRRGVSLRLRASDGASTTPACSAAPSASSPRLRRQSGHELDSGARWRRAKLKRGASVADVGCGHGASTILMAKAYPKSQFTGFDFHQPSIDRATEVAHEAGLANRVRFAKATAKEFPGTYDLVAMLRLPA